MKSIFSRTLKALCIVGAVAMLSACGASSTVDPFVATRVIAFGDGFNLVDGNGYGLSTVRTLETDITIAGRIAAGYNIVVKGSPPNPLPATGGFSYATDRATATDVSGQIDTFLTQAGGVVGKKDLIIIAVGNWDIKANVEQLNPPETIDVATTNLVAAIQRLTNAGAEHVVVMPAINMARTPWAWALTGLVGARKNLADIEQMSITTEGSTGFTSFNFLLLNKLTTAYTQDRKPVYVFDRSGDFNSFAGYYGTDRTTRIANYSGLAITADTGLYVPVCTANTAYAGCALAGLSTTSPLSATAYQSYVFADDINLTPLANRYLADRILVSMKSIGWAP